MKKKDFQSDQMVKWCPGCGDYAILSAVQNALAELNQPPDETAFISGIGCSSRFPYYMNTYGFHTIHGRAPSVATGLKIANPQLSVWVITGDGDGLSIGGNHLMHIMRRNLDVNILLFNNRIYGLTKGQYSPTSERGKITKSSPMGSLEEPIQPIRFALASGATFVARTYDVNPKHMAEVFVAASKHRGTSFIEILQNCVIFNDKTYDPITGRDVRFDRLIQLEEGQPLIFGKDGDKGIELNCLELEVKDLVDAEDSSGLLVHNSNQVKMDYAHMISGMEGDLPTAMGVFRKVEKPVYEELLLEQIDRAQQDKGTGKLEELFHQGDVWKV